MAPSICFMYFFADDSVIFFLYTIRSKSYPPEQYYITTKMNSYSS